MGGVAPDAFVRSCAKRNVGSPIAEKARIDSASRTRSFVVNPQNFRHLLVEKSLSRSVGLNPSAIDYELRNRSLSRTPDNLFGSPRSDFDVDFSERNIVLCQKALGRSAVGAPEGRINRDLHLRRI